MYQEVLVPCLKFNVFFVPVWQPKVIDRDGILFTEKGENDSFCIVTFFFFFLYCYLMGHNADSTTCPQNSRQNDCLAVLQQCTCKSNIKKHTTLLIKVIMPT